jgi:RNA polymerase sigma factor (sigma-70 family)
MPEKSDMDLVSDFARDQSEADFAELVRRHLNLVYSVALRYTSNGVDAQDIAQAVFLLLARKAVEMPARTVLTGWLYETTRFTALRWLRATARRQAREQEAYMQSLNADSTDVWQQIAPHLESAMSQLAERDRTLLALRFYENKTGREAADLLGIREDAAHKRTTRALEKLRKCFGKRGVAVSAAAIATAVSGNAIQSAPAGLAAAITAAALSGTVVTTAAVIAATTKIITMAALRKAVVAAALVVTTGVGVFEVHQNSTLRADYRALQQSQAPLAAQIQQLQREHDDATNRFAAMSAAMASAVARNNHNNLELLQLRGMAGVARRATEETEQLRRQLAQHAAEAGTNPLAGAMMDSMKQTMELQVQGHLARLDASLHLTPEQMLSASNILMRQADLMTASMQQTFTGKFDKDKLFRMGKAAGDPDTQIKALLTPEQQADFPAYKQAEAANTAGLAANNELVQLKSTLNLTSDQLDPVYAALYNLNFDQLTGNAKPPASVTGMSDAMQWTLDQKTAALEPLLTPAQLELYRQQQSSQSKLMKNITDKMLGSGETK